MRKFLLYVFLGTAMKKIQNFESFYVDVRGEKA